MEINFTKISELKEGQTNVNVEGILVEIGEKRTFSKFGKELVVCHAILEDDSGAIKISLWNEDAYRFKEGDRIKIRNGYVSKFQGEKNITTGKFGFIEKVIDSEKLNPEEKDDKIEESYKIKNGEEVAI